MTTAERGVCALVLLLLSVGVVASYVAPDWFHGSYVVEDGMTEWLTVFVLLAAFLVCLRRLMRAWGRQPAPYIAVTGFLTFFCLFGVGEEVSWGQRLLGFESPDFFVENNSQQETGLHNLEIVIGGENYKVNRILFGTGLAVMFAFYVAVMTPLYRKVSGVKGFLDRWAVPMPRDYQIGLYVLVLAVAELLVDSPRRGEITEVGGSLVFFLNLTYPANVDLFEGN